MAKKTILSCAMTGSSTPKDKCPSVPVTPEEIAEDVYRVWKAGVSIVHLHMRDEKLQNSLDASLFRKTIQLIRAHEDCDVIINCTSSSKNIGLTTEQRLEHFMTIPEIEVGTFDAGTLNMNFKTVFENTPEFLQALGLCYQKYNIQPEVELFDTGWISNLKWFIENGYLKKGAWCQLVMGAQGGAPGTPEALCNMVRLLPEGTPWSAFGVGTAHLPIMYTALALGGHVRVGLEDNIYYAKGRITSNLELAERAVRIIREFGNEIATPNEAREIIGITK